MARVLLLAIDYRSLSELGGVLVEGGHALLPVRTVDEATGAWDQIQPEVVVLDLPSPGLCLYRLERRLSTSMIDWARLPVICFRQPEAAPEDHLHEESNLIVPLDRPFNAGELLEITDRLAQLRRLLFADMGSPGNSPSLPPPMENPTLAWPEKLEGEILRIVDRRDTTERGHGERVSRLAVRLGRALSMDRATLSGLERAGRLHDLGKLALSPAILRKPARLDDDEYQSVRQHASRGAAMIQELTGDSIAAGLVHDHHEHLDGSGYHGVAGEKLSLAAQVLGLAETWDALTHRQAFRPAFSTGSALGMVRQGRGCRWEGAVVEALETLVN